MSEAVVVATAEAVQKRTNHAKIAALKNAVATKVAVAVDTAADTAAVVVADMAGKSSKTLFRTLKK